VVSINRDENNGGSNQPQRNSGNVKILRQHRGGISISSDMSAAWQVWRKTSDGSSMANAHALAPLLCATRWRGGAA